MVSLGVIVCHELRDRVLKGVLTEEDHSVQALGFIERTKRSANAFKFGDRGGRRMRWMPSRSSALRNSAEYFCISVENQIPLAAKKSVFGIGDITRNLGHPAIVRVRCDAGDVHRPRCDVDEEQEVIRDPSLERVYLDAQEIGCRQTFPVGFKKRRPSSVSIPLGGGLDAVFMEDVGDGAASHVMSQIGERAANARVRPGVPCAGGSLPGGSRSHPADDG